MFPRSGGGPKQLFDMLHPIIKELILPGKRIISDTWKAYDILQNEGCVHLKVNHSLNFVDPDTGALHKKSRAHVGSKTKFTRTRRSKDHNDSLIFN